MSRTPFIHLAAFAAVIVSGAFSAACGQEYRLELPGGEGSAATLSAARLTIVDAQGRRFTYVPHPEHNSPDRQYLGFYCEEAQRYLRWPALGEGRMYVGTRRLGGVDWNVSQMRVVPTNPRPTRQTAKLPLPGGVGTAERRGGQSTVQGGFSPAVLKLGDEYLAAFVDDRGQLQAFLGANGKWRPETMSLDEPLTPGGAIVLDRDPGSPTPLVYAVDRRGNLIVIRDGRASPVLSGREAPRFYLTAPLTRGVMNGESRLAVIDERGRAGIVDPRRGTWQLVDGRRDAFESGGALALTESGGRAAVFGIDRGGNLLAYWGGATGWSEPERIDRGLMSGGGIDAISMNNAQHGHGPLAVSSVDSKGRLRVWTGGRNHWEARHVDVARFSPGSPVAFHRHDVDLAGVAIATDGRLLEWRAVDSDWSSRVIGDGFISGRVPFLVSDDSCFAVDRAMRLVAAQRGPRGWQNYLCVPGRSFAPQLVRRTVIADQPLPPAQIVFANSHNEELIVRLIDIEGAQGAKELVIPPGQTVEHRVERNGGGTLEEVYFVPGPLGELVEDVQQVRIPAKPVYNAVVYANRVTSVYFDRTKNKGPIPDETNMSLVSLGAFTLPAGDRLQDGDQIDVYREAVSRRNPGAASLLDPTLRP